MAIHTGNYDINIHFWIVMMQQVAMQLQLLVCETKANVGILFGKDAF